MLSGAKTDQSMHLGPTCGEAVIGLTPMPCHVMSSDCQSLCASLPGDTHPLDVQSEMHLPRLVPCAMHFVDAVNPSRVLLPWDMQSICSIHLHYAAGCEITGFPDSRGTQNWWWKPRFWTRVSDWEPRNVFGNPEKSWEIQIFWVDFRRKPNYISKFRTLALHFVPCKLVISWHNVRIAAWVWSCVCLI